MRLVAVILTVALAAAPVRAATFTSKGAIQTLDGKWRNAEITVDGSLVTVLPKKQGKKKALPVLQEYIPEVVQYFVKTKRRGLAGLIVGAAGVAGMYFALKSLRTRVDDALGGGNVRSGDRDRVNGVFNALSGILYAVVVGIGGATAAGKSHNQFAGIETADARSVTIRVPQSEFAEFRKPLDAASTSAKSAAQPHGQTPDADRSQQQPPATNQILCPGSYSSRGHWGSIPIKGEKEKS